MELSYSFHLSAKKHAVTSKSKVNQVSKHNLRLYESDSYDRSKIEILAGSKTSILDDCKKIYHQEFDEVLKKYNSGKRPDRQISDYFKHVSESRNDVAAEIIIQVGDKDFWADKSDEEKHKMTYLFKDQLRALGEYCPDFKIASAVIHYDESSPHMHVVGVPVASGYKKGLEKQVAKTKIFTQESLSELQDTMRVRAQRGIDLNRDVFGDSQLKDKEKGRNHDIPMRDLAEYYYLQAEINNLQLELNDVQYELADLKDEKNTLQTDLNALQAQENAFIDKMVKHGLERYKKAIPKALNFNKLAQALSDVNNNLENIGKYPNLLPTLQKYCEELATAKQQGMKEISKPSVVGLLNANIDHVKARDVAAVNKQVREKKKHDIER